MPPSTVLEGRPPCRPRNYLTFPDRTEPVPPEKRQSVFKYRPLRNRRFKIFDSDFDLLNLTEVFENDSPNVSNKIQQGPMARNRIAQGNALGILGY